MHSKQLLVLHPLFAWYFFSFSPWSWVSHFCNLASCVSLNIEESIRPCLLHRRRWCPVWLTVLWGWGERSRLGRLSSPGLCLTSLWPAWSTLRCEFFKQLLPVVVFTLGSEPSFLYLALLKVGELAESILQHHLLAYLVHW